MAASHADKHDLEKLARWRRDLSAGAPGRFPVYALFLVSAADRGAHETFRQFRVSFQARGAPFAHLMIFGQHGVSDTVRGLLAGLGLPADAVPLLALFAAPSATTAYTIALAEGNPADPPGGEPLEPWRAVLSLVEGTVDRDDAVLDLASLPYLASRQLDGGSFHQLAGWVLEKLS